jgi:hypothetical protein
MTGGEYGEVCLRKKCKRDDLSMGHHFQEERIQFYEGELFHPPDSLNIFTMFCSQC